MAPSWNMYSMCAGMDVSMNNCPLLNLTRWKMPTMASRASMPRAWRAGSAVGHSPGCATPQHCRYETCKSFGIPSQSETTSRRWNADRNGSDMRRTPPVAAGGAASRCMASRTLRSWMGAPRDDSPRSLLPMERLYRSP
eukprot:5486095-Pyramimonas_sp.AAC.1